MKKAVTAFIVVLITIVITSGMFLYYYLNSFSNNGKEIGESIVEPKKVKAGEPFNILLLGVDIGVAGSKNSPKRSDTMVVFHYDPNTSEAAMVSIPRDTRVSIRGNAEKINAANAFGGTELAISSVEKLLGIAINYYVEIDYEGFRKFIDAIGGIDTVIPYDMNYDDPYQNLHIHFKKGQNIHLDGKKAEEFVRWRKNNDNTGYAEGDIGRIETQQEFIIKVVEKLKSPAIIPKIPSIVSILPQYIDTNIEPMTILSLSMELSKINSGSIQKFTLQGESKIIEDLWYFIYEPEKNADVVSLLGGKPSTGTVKTNNKDIKIQVMNGSGVNGAAAKVKQELEGKGYTVLSTGNISGIKFTSSHIIDKTLKGNNAKQVAFELDISNIKRDQDSLSKADIVIILGSDIADSTK